MTPHFGDALLSSTFEGNDNKKRGISLCRLCQVLCRLCRVLCRSRGPQRPPMPSIPPPAKRHQFFIFR